MAITADKIKKLLTLAGNNPNKNEAEAALLKAQQLMADSGISMSTVNAHGTDEKEIAHGNFKSNDRSNIAKWQKIIVPVISKNFRCEALMSRMPIGDTGKWGWGWELIGVKEDVEICTSVMEFTFNYFRKSWAVFYKNWKQEGHIEHRIHGRGAAPRLRADFAINFAAGLREVFAEQCTEKGLVIVRDKAVDKELSTMKIKHVKSPTSRMGSQEAGSAGYEAGKGAKKDAFIA